MRRGCSARVRQNLLDTFVCHKVDAGTDRVAYCALLAFGHSCQSFQRPPTQMQMEPRVQASPAPMLNQVLCGLERPQVLIALPDRIVLASTIGTVSHQDRYLRAKLRQLEGA